MKSKIDKLSKEREKVRKWIQQETDSLFTNKKAQVILFGSLITGLALESSDMDLAITGLSIDDRYTMISEMAKLANTL